MMEENVMQTRGKHIFRPVRKGSPKDRSLQDGTLSTSRRFYDGGILNLGFDQLRRPMEMKA
jgi:hypothetical protein